MGQNAVDNSDEIAAAAEAAVELLRHIRPIRAPLPPPSALPTMAKLKTESENNSSAAPVSSAGASGSGAVHPSQDYNVDDIGDRLAALCIMQSNNAIAQAQMRGSAPSSSCSSHDD